MKLISVTSIFFTVFSVSFAQDFIQLGGSLPNHLTAEKPYLVVSDIYVSPGSLVTINAGTVFLFESFTGLHVQGTVYIKGELEKPVVFTSKNDSMWNRLSTVPAAHYDWNGIDIYESAIGTNFTQCIIRYSVYGLRSQTQHFKINNSFFSNNGKADVTINGERKVITPDESFSYGLPVDTSQVVKIPEPTRLSMTDTSVANKSITAFKEKPEKRNTVRIQILRYTSLAASIVSFGATAWYYDERFKSADLKLRDLSYLDDMEKKRYTSKDWNHAEKDRNRKMGLCIAGASGAVISMGFFALTFAF